MDTRPIPDKGKAAPAMGVSPHIFTFWTPNRGLFRGLASRWVGISGRGWGGDLGKGGVRVAD